MSAARTCRRSLALALLLCFTGCTGSHGDVDLLEARLRDQQDLVARYERLIDSQNSELATARKESDLLRAQLADQSVPPLLPEHADVLLRAERLAFHSLMTGTRDSDSQPGDDLLNVVLMPQAASGDIVRLVGAVEIEALDLSQPAEARSIGQWTFSPEQARDAWHSGFLASGFQFEIPWENPSAGEAVLHARLIAPDGRRLEASHQIRVEPRIRKTTPSLAARPQIQPLSSRNPLPAVVNRLAPPTSRTARLPEASPQTNLVARPVGIDLTPEEIGPASPYQIPGGPSASVGEPAAFPGSEESPRTPEDKTTIAPSNPGRPVDSHPVMEPRATAPSATPAGEFPIPGPGSPQARLVPEPSLPGEPIRNPQRGESDTTGITITPLPYRRRSTSQLETPPAVPRLGPTDNPGPEPRSESPPEFPATVAPVSRGGVILMSDRWTDESIPYLR